MVTVTCHSHHCCCEQVVGESGELVAVNKVAGVPVHAVGQYRKNTVVGLLQAHRPDLMPLFPAHRLDRPVSGLLLFARSAAAANKLREQMEVRQGQEGFSFSCCFSLRSLPLRSAYDLQPPLRHAPTYPTSSIVRIFKCRIPWVTQERLGHPGLTRESLLAAAAQGRTLEKVYVARVQGAFPSGPQLVDVPLSWDPQASHAAAHPELSLDPETAVPAAAAADLLGSRPDEACSSAERSEANHAQERSSACSTSQPSCAKHRSLDGKRTASGAATKPAVTEFRLLHVAPDGASSLVECRPKTGRTHQLRVHLQYLGYPIANDTQYGGLHGPVLANRIIQSRNAPTSTTLDPAGQSVSKKQRLLHPCEKVQSPQLDINGKCDEDCSTGTAQVQEGQNDLGSRHQLSDRDSDPCVQATGSHDHQQNAEAAQHSALRQLTAPNEIASLFPYRVEDSLFDPVCAHCPFMVPSGYPIDLQPLWLHCLSYHSDDWEFSTDMPTWAATHFALPSRGTQGPGM